MQEFVQPCMVQTKRAGLENALFALLPVCALVSLAFMLFFHGIHVRLKSVTSTRNTSSPCQNSTSRPFSPIPIQVYKRRKAKELHLPLPEAYGAKALQTQLFALQKDTKYNSKQKLYLWWANSPDGRGEHFYWPAASTVAQALADWKGRSSWEIVVSVLPPLMEKGKPKKSANRTELIERTHFKRGDVIVWFGNHGTPGPIFAQLKPLGVYIVYYQTEPITACAYNYREVDEIWDYSWKSIDACKTNKRAPVLRYVPSGIIPTQARAKHHPGHQHAVFFGVRQSRNCYWSVHDTFGKLPGHEHDNSGLANTLIEGDNIWGDEPLAAFVKHESIFVNFPKACVEQNLSIGDDAPMTSLRVSILLSARAILISSHAYRKDEAEYEGIIPFVPLPALHEEYDRVARMTSEERLLLADKQYENFAHKFYPAKIFERAGIYTMLEKRSRSGQRGSALL